MEHRFSKIETVQAQTTWNVHDSTLGRSADLCLRASEEIANWGGLASRADCWIQALTTCVSAGWLWPVVCMKLDDFWI